MLASGTLKAGTLKDGYVCNMTFTVRSVPPASLYEVTVANGESANYTQGQMEQADWTVSFGAGVSVTF